MDRSDCLEGHTESEDEEAGDEEPARSEHQDACDQSERDTHGWTLDADRYRTIDKPD